MRWDQVVWECRYVKALSLVSIQFQVLSSLSILSTSELWKLSLECDHIDLCLEPVEFPMVTQVTETELKGSSATWPLGAVT